MESIQWQTNQHKNPHASPPSVASVEEMEKVLHFHQTLPGYSPTPLFRLEFLAKYLGLGEILVKDESYRFGLNSFKSLGSSYAVAKYLDRENIDRVHSFSDLKEKIKNKPIQTFATATDGNHGLGLAWTAKLLGQRAFVYMPKGSSKYRLEKIRELGAHAEITDRNYDDTVRYVARLSKENGWVLFQDTSWEGYVDVPMHIMHGYLTILGEYLEQGKTIKTPTHVILQAGVGSFAAAIISGLKQFIDTPMVFIILEPTQADCFFQSASSTDGLPKKTKGDLSTMMAGLSCGEPNPVAWDILKTQELFLVSLERFLWDSCLKYAKTLFCKILKRH
jgi:diaminopropionate ammonia-lyase